MWVRFGTGVAVARGGLFGLEQCFGGLAMVDQSLGVVREGLLMMLQLFQVGAMAGDVVRILLEPFVLAVQLLGFLEQRAVLRFEIVVRRGGLCSRVLVHYTPA